MKRLGVETLLVLLAMAVAPSAAIACSCTNFEAAPSEFVEQADVIFFGVAISAILDAEEPAIPPFDNGIAKFKSFRSLKGINDGDIVEAGFHASGTSCDLPVAVGQQAFYFLYADNGRLLYTLCGQPSVFSRLSEYLDLFEKEFGVSFEEFRRLVK